MSIALAVNSQDALHCMDSLELLSRARKTDYFTVEVDKHQSKQETD